MWLFFHFLQVSLQTRSPFNVPNMGMWYIVGVYFFLQVSRKLGTQITDCHSKHGSAERRGGDSLSPKPQAGVVLISLGS
jgi:hypothetical protein